MCIWDDYGGHRSSFVMLTPCVTRPGGGLYYSDGSDGGLGLEAVNSTVSLKLWSQDSVWVSNGALNGTHINLLQCLGLTRIARSYLSIIATAQI